MRSGSSLLVHILNSNPEITGYGETHIVYGGPQSFVDLDRKTQQKFWEHERIIPKSRYIMDKILHDFIEDESVLNHPALKNIFLVRDPLHAIPSIIRNTNKDTVDSATKYYVRQMNRLNNLYGYTNENSIFITYDDIVSSTKETLTTLSSFLDLEEELSPEYDTIWSTGIPSIGDPSDTIKKGSVINKKAPENDMDIKKENIQKATICYNKIISSFHK